MFKLLYFIVLCY